MRARREYLIHTDRMWTGACRSCGAIVEWAYLTDTGAPHPFDRPLVLAPMLIEVENVGLVDRTRTLSHFATCPNAVSWRRTRAE